MIGFWEVNTFQGVSGAFCKHLLSGAGRVSGTVLYCARLSLAHGSSLVRGLTLSLTLPRII